MIFSYPHFPIVVQLSSPKIKQVIERFSVEASHCPKWKRADDIFFFVLQRKRRETCKGNSVRCESQKAGFQRLLRVVSAKKWNKLTSWVIKEDINRILLLHYLTSRLSVVCLTSVFSKLIQNEYIILKANSLVGTLIIAYLEFEQHEVFYTFL